MYYNMVHTKEHNIILLRVCSVLEIGGDIGHADVVIMVYSTPTPPSGHIMHKANAICCTPLVEMTQCSSEPLTWLEVLLKELGLHNCRVMDIFSECGEYN